MGFDSKFENGSVVTPDGIQSDVAIGVTDGEIAAVGDPAELDEADRVVDLDGQYLFPWRHRLPHSHSLAGLRVQGGLVERDGGRCRRRRRHDGHRHAQHRPDGGLPETLSEVYDIADEDAYVDFQSYAVLTSSNYDQVAPLADAGAAGFKVFLGTTFGEIEPPDDGELYEAMQDAATVDKRIGFHEENDAILSHLEAKFREAGRNDPIDHSHSRPVVAEAEAVSRIILLADHADCPVHMFHLSSGTGAELVARGRPMA